MRRHFDCCIGMLMYAQVCSWDNLSSRAAKSPNRAGEAKGEMKIESQIDICSGPMITPPPLSTGPYSPVLPSQPRVSLQTCVLL